MSWENAQRRLRAALAANDDAAALQAARDMAAGMHAERAAEEEASGPVPAALDADTDTTSEGNER